MTLLQQRALPRPEVVAVPADTLVLACRLSGLSLTELWWEYVALGGSLSPAELAARMAPGHEWPVHEDLVLSAAADEALINGGLPPLGAVPAV